MFLNLNPGYAKQDLADYAEPVFRRAAADNLTHAIDALGDYTKCPRASTSAGR